MRILWASTLITATAISLVQTSRFGVDGKTTSASTTVATIQPRTAAPGYSWIRIYFYSSSLTASERANATKGEVESIRTGWSAVLQLTVDKATTVWQIDLSLPGHTCTIAASDRDAKNVLQEFQFDGTRLRLTGKGFHDCDMTSLRVPNQRFEWEMNFETSVITKSPGPR
jgi:hypothetical protein